MPSQNDPGAIGGTARSGAERPPLPDDEADRLSRRRTLVGFAGFGLYAAGAYGAWRWLMSRPLDGGIHRPMRQVLRLNETLSEKLFRSGSRMDQFPPGTAPVGGTRMNTAIGVDTAVTADAYRLHLTGLAAGDSTAALTLDEVKALPTVRQTTRLCCVEGWSTWANWAGARVADLVAKYPTAGTPPYVGMATADNGYYVGLDRASALHPQTLLVYELDGQPLSPAHGFPLRLAIPTKYGIKNIKQMARIDFTATRPPDYWAEQGYDWFAGL